MFYIIYLVGILFYLVKGIGYHFTNFIDQITGIYILAPCILMLFCTKSFRAFGRSFLLAFGKKEDSISRCEESLESVQMVMMTIVISGVLCFLIGMINGCRSLSFESADSMIWLLLNTTVAMISLFYPMLICLMLLPLPFLLKKHLNVLKTASRENKCINTK